MRLPSPRPTFVLLAAALIAAGASAQPKPPPPPDVESAEQVLRQQGAALRRRLVEARVVILDESDGAEPDGYVRALVLFAQPRRRTLRLLSQTARQGEFRPELKRVESQGWSESVAVDTHHMKIMFMAIDYRLRTHFDWEGGRIWWELDPSFHNQLESVEGFWELFALDGHRTLGRFGTRVSVGPALPAWLQDYATRKNLPQTMDHVRRWIDSDGTYRP